MDLSIVKLILQNTNEEVKNLDAVCYAESEDIEFDDCRIINNDLVSALARSITGLLCHKVSPAAHQRYLVRTNIIEQLRSWCRVTHRYSHLQLFTDREKTANFTKILLDKHFTEECISRQTSVKHLIPLGYALVRMQSSYANAPKKLEMIVKKIISMNKTPESDKFLNDLTDKYDELSLTLPTIETLHVCRCEQLIEMPLVDSFVSFVANRSTENGLDVNATKHPMELNENDGTERLQKLLKYSFKSSCIFQLLSSILKEIFENLDCLETVIDFSRCIMNRVRQLCTEQGSTMLDLYPRHLQGLVILLRIEPSLHTNGSKNYTFQLLNEIYTSNRQEILILLIQFPMWVKEFVNFVNDDDTSTMR